MSYERRPHWDDDLIAAVCGALSPHRWINSEEAYTLIAAVEDWFQQNAHMPSVSETCAQAEARTAQIEAQVQAVRDVCERIDVPAVAGDWMAGYASARRDILRILDGGDA